MVLFALLSSAGCNREERTRDPKEALEKAYRLGLLTREEYEAKKAALPGLAQAKAPLPAAVPDKPSAKEPRFTVTLPPEVRPSAKVDSAKDPLEEPTLSKGCDDTGSRPGGESGPQERVFDAPMAAVKRAAIAALTSLYFQVQRNANNQMDASKNKHISALIGAGGEHVILTQKNWSNAVLSQIACKLSQPGR